MELSFGTAGWSYKDWIGTVYPEKIRSGFNHLEFLAKTFDFIEVNTTFYRIPELKLVNGWIKKTETSEGFNFWIKLFNKFTHSRNYSALEVSAFKQSIQPLVENKRMAGLLIQFPYSFKLNTKNYEYLSSLTNIFKDQNLAVEFRHISWNCNEILNFFKSNNLIWVNIDQPVISSSLPLTSLITNKDISYFRLHGRNYNSWFSNEGRDARYNYDYKTSEIMEIAKSVNDLKKSVKKIFISGNNHYKGNAVKNLLELKKLLIE